MSLRLLSRSLRSATGRSLRPRQIAPLALVRHNSTSIEPVADIIERIANKSVKAALADIADYKEPSLQAALTEAIEKQTESIRWVQELLDETEGGGYIVPEAGLLNHAVEWGAIDDFGHVNNKVYLAWFESARVFLFKRYGAKYDTFSTFMSGKGVGPIIRSCNLAWRYAITFPDNVTVVHKVEPLEHSDRFLLKGVVVSHNARKVAARITEVLVTVDYDKGGVKAPIPDGIRKVLEDRIALQEKLAPSKKK